MHKRADIVAAIVAAKIRATCEACGRDGDWNVPSQQEDPEAVETLMMVQPGNMSSGALFVPMICGNCSNTRLLHLQTLTSFLDEKAEEVT